MNIKAGAGWRIGAVVFDFKLTSTRDKRYTISLNVMNISLNDESKVTLFRHPREGGDPFFS